MKNRLLSLGLLSLAAAYASAQVEPSQLPVTTENRITFLDLHGASIGDAARLLTVLTGQTIVATDASRQRPVDASIENLSLEAALKVVCRSAGVVYRYDSTSRLYTIVTLDEYQRTSVEDTRDGYEMRTFRVGPANLNQIASAIYQLFGDRVLIAGGEPIEDFREIPGNRARSSSNSSSRGDRLYSGGLSRSNTTPNTPYYGGVYGYGGYGGGYGNNYYGGGYDPYYGGNNGYDPYYGSNGYNDRYSNNGRYGNNRFRNQLPLGATGSDQNQPRLNTLNSESALELESNRSTTANTPVGSTVNLSPDVNSLASSRVQRAQNSGQPIIYVSTSYEHSFLLVRTTDRGALEEIASLIEKLDQIVPQVILEMKILQLDVGNGYTAGVTLNANTNDAKRRDINGVDTGAFTGWGNAIGTGNFASEAGSTFAYQFISESVRARIDLLASDNRVEVIATPLLIAANNRVAQIEVGEERILTVGASAQTRTIPSSVIGGTPTTETYIQTETERRTIGVILNILPRINEDDTVTLSIYQESSTLKPQNNSIIVGTSSILIDSVDTANVDATVVAKDGRTIAVGGLIRTEQNKGQSKVPILGDIPWIGNAFKRKTTNARKTELILLITPHVLKGRGQDTEVTRSIMNRVSSHNYHVTGEAAGDQPNAELKRYQEDNAKAYEKLRGQSTNPNSRTPYWDQLGASPAIPTPAP